MEHFRIRRVYSGVGEVEGVKKAMVSISFDVDGAFQTQASPLIGEGRDG